MDGLGCQLPLQIIMLVPLIVDSHNGSFSGQTLRLCRDRSCIIMEIISKGNLAFKRNVRFINKVNSSLVVALYVSSILLNYIIPDNDLLKKGDCLKEIFIRTSCLQSGILGRRDFDLQEVYITVKNIGDTRQS